MNSLIRAGFACVLVLAASCSDSKSSGSKPATDSSQIGSKGGVVTAGDASVDVPAGALPSAKKIGVAPSEVDVAPPDGYVLAGPPIAFTPHGLSFDVPVTLTLPYTATSAPLTVLRLEDEQDTTWEVMKGGKFSKGLATLEVSTFSIYAVAAESAPDGAAGAAGAGGMSQGGGSAVAGSAGAPDSAGATDVGGAAMAGAAAGGAPSSAGDVSWSCDSPDAFSGMRLCTDYLYPALVVQLLGDQFAPSCQGDAVLGEKCDTSGAVVGCRANNVDAPGITVTNWFYDGTKQSLMNGTLCTENDSAWVDPP